MGATGGDGLLTNLFLTNHISKEQHDAIVAMVESARQGRVIVFEKGLRPKPVWLCVAWISAGSIGILSVLLLWMRRRRARCARRAGMGRGPARDRGWKRMSRRVDGRDGMFRQLGAFVMLAVASASLPAMWVGGFLGGAPHPGCRPTAAVSRRVPRRQSRRRVCRAAATELAAHDDRRCMQPRGALGFAGLPLRSNARLSPRNHPADSADPWLALLLVSPVVDAFPVGASWRVQQDRVSDHEPASDSGSPRARRLPAPTSARSRSG